MTNNSEISSHEIDLYRTTYSFDLSFGDTLLCGIISDPFIDQMGDFRFFPHNHAFYELQIVEDGPLYLRNGNVEYMAQLDSLCITHPYEYHTYLRPQNPDHKYRVATFAFHIKTLRAGEYKGINLAAAIQALNRTYNLPSMRSELMPILEQIGLEFRKKNQGIELRFQTLCACFCSARSGTCCRPSPRRPPSAKSC